MADGPWRCSECGTVNEPVANSCRTCGRWPSLFELQDSVVEEAEGGEATEPGPEDENVEPLEEDQATYTEPYAEPEPEGRPRRRRRLASIVVPLAFVAYLVISFFFSDR